MTKCKWGIPFHTRDDTFIGKKTTCCSSALNCVSHEGVAIVTTLEVFLNINEPTKRYHQFFIWHSEPMNPKNLRNLPSLKLTNRPWKWMVGRWVSFWASGLFSGACKLLVLGRVPTTSGLVVSKSRNPPILINKLRALLPLTSKAQSYKCCWESGKTQGNLNGKRTWRNGGDTWDGNKTQGRTVKLPGGFWLEENNSTKKSVKPSSGLHPPKTHMLFENQCLEDVFFLLKSSFSSGTC